MKKKNGKIILSLLVSLFLAVGVCSFTIPKGYAEESEREIGKEISIYDKFIGKNHKDPETGNLVWDEYATTISQSHVFDYYNVVNDKMSGYGLVTGAVWGATVSAGDGYLTYKIQADEGYLLSGLDFNFTANHGHQGLPEYYGDKNTNIRVSVSADNVNYEKVYDLGLQRGFPTSGNMALRENMRKNVDEYAEGKPFVFLRFDMIHLTFAEVKENHQSVIGNVDKQQINLERLGLYLHEVSIRATQMQDSEENWQTKSYNYGTKGDIGSDYGIYAYENLAKDTQGNADWGLIPSKVWGGTVNAERAYLVYQIPSYPQYETKGLYMDLTYCLRNMNNANFLISVSQDGTTYEPFYDFKQEHINTYCSAWSERKTKTLCLSEYLGNYKFVKITIEHDTTNVFLQNLGALLHEISFRSFVNERASLVGGITEDYTSYAINDNGFTANAFQTEGMQIKSVHGANGLGNFNAQEGFIVYKIKTNGEPFTALKLSLQIEFANSAGLENESVKLYVGDDGENFAIVGTLKPVDGKTDFEILLDKEVSGKESFYLQMRISCPNTTSATVVRSLNISSAQRYTISYQLNGGDSIGDNPNGYSPEKGLVLGKGYKEGYYFVGWYEDENCTQRVDEISVGRTGDITLYAKWMKAENEAQTILTQSSGCKGSISCMAVTVGICLVGLAIVKKKTD